MKTAAEIGQRVRIARKANDAMRRACRGRGWPAGRYGTVKRNKRRFRHHWRQFWRLTDGDKVAVIETPPIVANEDFQEPNY